MIFDDGVDDERLEELNIFRKKCGLDLIRKKKRKCISCNRKFISEGLQNRMCRQCRPNTI